MYMLTFTFGLRSFIFHVFFLGPGVLPCVDYNFAWFCLHFCIVFPDWMVWRGVCAILVCPHLQDVCTCLVWKAPCICWPSLGLRCFIFYGFSWVLESSSVFSRLPRLNGLERVCAILVCPHLQDVCTCLVWKAPCMCWPSLLACAASFFMFFRGSWSPPVCFLQLCTVLPSFLHSLPRLNGLERGVCHLSVPPFARCMHLSCVESSMYVLTFTLGLRCFIFHGFFLGPGVLPCVFYTFACFWLHFCIAFPDWSGQGCVPSSCDTPTCKKYAPVLCGKLHVYVDLHFWLALLHFSCIFRGSWSPPVCFLQFCMVLPSFLHSLPRLNGVERGVPS